MNYLSICCIAKDEDLLPDYRGKTYIDDFIDMYRFMGVEKFYIYDQGGSLLNRLRGQKDVSVVYYPRPKLQSDCYFYHIENHLSNSHWTLFVDVDEFLISNEDCYLDLKALMHSYDKPRVGAVQFNWKVFGSAGHIKKPKLPQFEAFILRENETRLGAVSRHTKVALKSGAAVIKKPSDPHHFHVTRNYRVVNSAGKIIIPQPLIEPIYSKAAVYHYVTRSHDEYQIKCLRNRVDFIETKDYPAIEHLDTILNTVIDTRAAEVFKML